MQEKPHGVIEVTISDHAGNAHYVFIGKRPADIISNILLLKGLPRITTLKNAAYLGMELQRLYDIMHGTERKFIQCYLPGSGYET